MNQNFTDRVGSLFFIRKVQCEKQTLRKLIRSLLESSRHPPTPFSKGNEWEPRGSTQAYKSDIQTHLGD